MQIESHCHEKALWICVHPCLMACDANPGLQKKLTQEFITETSTEDSGGHQLGERSQSKAHSQATQQGTHGFVLKPHPCHTHTHTMQAHSCTQMLFPNSPCRYRSMQHIVGQFSQLVFGEWWWFDHRCLRLECQLVGAESCWRWMANGCAKSRQLWGEVLKRPRPAGCP